MLEVVISVLLVCYQCFISVLLCVICVIGRYKFFISVLEMCYKCFMAIFGIKLIFGLTGLRTNGPSDNKADPITSP